MSPAIAGRACGDATSTQWAFFLETMMTAKQKINLRFCAMSAYYANEARHPQDVMMALGIDYAKAVPQSIADQWWFFDCQNVPAELPKFLSALELPESTIQKWME